MPTARQLAFSIRARSVRAVHVFFSILLPRKVCISWHCLTFFSFHIYWIYCLLLLSAEVRFHWYRNILFHLTSDLFLHEVMCLIDSWRRSTRPCMKRIYTAKSYMMRFYVRPRNTKISDRIKPCILWNCTFLYGFQKKNSHLIS